MKTINALVVDDDQASYEIFSYYLKKIKDVNVNHKWIDNTNDAIEEIKKSRYDLVFLDYQIDHRNGLELFAEAKPFLVDPKTQIETPAILLTGLTNQEVAVQAIHAGVSDFISKVSMNASLLNHVINNVLEKSSLRHELVKHNVQLKEKNETLMKQNKEIAHFYQTVSHELKTPLTSIKEFICILIDGIAGEISKEQREYLTVANRNCDQMTLFINDLLDISRISIGKFAIDKKLTSINRMLSEVTLSFREAAREHKINLSLELPEKLPEIIIDEKRIYQVFMNLLSNAIKFTPANGEIKVKASYDEKEKKIIIDVSDTGCGIAEKHVLKIFDRLYQVKSDEYHHFRGLGLGLAICKEIVDLHNAEISVKSEIGKGSVFTVKFAVENQAQGGNQA